MDSLFNDPSPDIVRGLLSEITSASKDSDFLLDGKTMLALLAFKQGGPLDVSILMDQCLKMKTKDEPTRKLWSERIAIMMSDSVTEPRTFHDVCDALFNFSTKDPETVRTMFKELIRVRCRFNTNPSEVLWGSFKTVLSGLDFDSASLMPDLKKWSSVNDNMGSGQCHAVFARNTGLLGYRCLTCSKDPSCIMCSGCFHSSAKKHFDHVVRATRVGDGCCDCGDGSSWSVEGMCDAHTPQVSDLPDVIPACERRPVQAFAEFLAIHLYRSIFHEEPQGTCWGTARRAAASSAFENLFVFYAMATPAQRLEVFMSTLTHISGQSAKMRQTILWCLTRSGECMTALSRRIWTHFSAFESKADHSSSSLATCIMVLGLVVSSRRTVLELIQTDVSVKQSVVKQYVKLYASLQVNGGSNPQREGAVLTRGSDATPPETQSQRSSETQPPVLSETRQMEHRNMNLEGVKGTQQADPKKALDIADSISVQIFTIDEALEEAEHDIVLREIWGAFRSRLLVSRWDFTHLLGLTRDLQYLFSLDKICSHACFEKSGLAIVASMSETLSELLRTRVERRLATQEHVYHDSAIGIQMYELQYKFQRIFDKIASFACHKCTHEQLQALLNAAVSGIRGNLANSDSNGVEFSPFGDVVQHFACSLLVEACLKGTPLTLDFKTASQIIKDRFATVQLCNEIRTGLWIRNGSAFNGWGALYGTPNCPMGGFRRDIGCIQAVLVSVPSSEDVLWIICMGEKRTVDKYENSDMFDRYQLAKAQTIASVMLAVSNKPEYALGLIDSVLPSRKLSSSSDRYLALQTALLASRTVSCLVSKRSMSVQKICKEVLEGFGQSDEAHAVGDDSCSLVEVMRRDIIPSVASMDHTGRAETSVLRVNGKSARCVLDRQYLSVSACLEGPWAELPESVSSGSPPWNECNRLTLSPSVFDNLGSRSGGQCCDSWLSLFQQKVLSRLKDVVLVALTEVVTFLTESEEKSAGLALSMVCSAIVVDRSALTELHGFGPKLRDILISKKLDRYWPKSLDTCTSSTPVGASTTPVGASAAPVGTSAAPVGDVAESSAVTSASRQSAILQAMKLRRVSVGAALESSQVDASGPSKMHAVANGEAEAEKRDLGDCVYCGEPLISETLTVQLGCMIPCRATRFHTKQILNNLNLLTCGHKAHWNCFDDAVEPLFSPDGQTVSTVKGQFGSCPCCRRPVNFSIPDFTDANSGTMKAVEALNSWTVYYISSRSERDERNLLDNIDDNLHCVRDAIGASLVRAVSKLDVQTLYAQRDGQGSSLWTLLAALLAQEHSDGCPFDLYSRKQMDVAWLILRFKSFEYSMPRATFAEQFEKALLPFRTSDDRSRIPERLKGILNRPCDALRYTSVKPTVCCNKTNQSGFICLSCLKVVCPPRIYSLGSSSAVIRDYEHLHEHTEDSRECGPQCVFLDPVNNMFLISTRLRRRRDDGFIHDAREIMIHLPGPFVDQFGDSVRGYADHCGVTKSVASAEMWARLEEGLEDGSLMYEFVSSLFHDLQDNVVGLPERRIPRPPDQHADGLGAEAGPVLSEASGDDHEDSESNHEDSEEEVEDADEVEDEDEDHDDDLDFNGNSDSDS